MLLFIGIQQRGNRKARTFQNIVCYCLSPSHPVNCAVPDNFKTSYVTVYPIPSPTVTASMLFQNIVCYCLSLSPMDGASCNRNFKTSYVTVYQKKKGKVLFVVEFQNIVCYCLSFSRRWFT